MEMKKPGKGFPFPGFSFLVVSKWIGYGGLCFGS
ncbi:hypothetical protein CCACVL1_06666 [Corchorus capsularis]|uniref:Uncharacterized protein n=1 Tax=Corchorus capsularis TaxID=210143 RepID=A0A1R3JDY9_COCAP|nr:hypothetical protein CCACVL1_06666 [Corchorus capsularis]